jgi:small subunit ribosomal protein S2
MAEVGIKELLEAGVHFGHQTRRWNPRMRRFIHGEREGIHIIDLLQTEELLRGATEFVTEVAAKGGVILFVGTKKQSRDSIEDWAERCGMPYVNRRWLGGVADMQRLPDAVLIVDLKTEEIALREAERLEIPIVGLVDSNCDPGPVSYVIPGNDDAIRSCELVISTLGGAIEGAAARWRAEEERRRAEEEERRRKEEEERKRREAEAKAKAEAEEKAKAEAEAKAQAAAQAEAEAKAKGEGDAKPEGESAGKPEERQEAAAESEPEKPPVEEPAPQSGGEG